MIELDRQDSVFILRMSQGENRFTTAFFDALDAALSEVERASGVALVTTGAGKFYSNGIDLEWLVGAGTDLHEFAQRLHRAFARLLAFPAITVAALNGHAFAGGALMALTQDFRIMRSDRGYWCLPEVDLGIPFTEPLAALARAKLPPQVAHEAMAVGKRYAAREGVSVGLFTDAAHEADVLSKAVSLASQLASKSGSTLGAIKRAAYAREIALLEGPPAVTP